MNKQILTLVFCISLLFSFNNSKAGSLYGNGEIEISKINYNYILDYLGTGVKNKSEGAKSRGRGTYLAISTTTDWAASSYCPAWACEDDGGVATKSWCQKQAKKMTGKKEKCKLLMKGHTIRWNGMKIKYSQGDDLKSLLKSAGITVKD